MNQLGETIKWENINYKVILEKEESTCVGCHFHSIKDENSQCFIGDKFAISPFDCGDSSRRSTEGVIYVISLNDKLKNL